MFRRFFFSSLARSRYLSLFSHSFSFILWSSGTATLTILQILFLKRSFFQAAVVSILLYGCTTWTLTKRLERRLDGNYTRMLRTVLNKSWRQHPTRLQLYGHLPPITKTIQVRRTRHAGHCWRSKDELISDVLLWTPTHGCARVGRPARTYIQQLCEDTGCNPEDLPEAMNDREKWRETVRDIRAGGATWWWLLGLAFWPRLGDPCIFQSPIGVYVCHFLGVILRCAYTNCSYGQISISCTFLSHVKSYTPSVLICCIRLLCDWWFHLSHHIAYTYYFVASYLISLWYDWFLWSCFVLLLGDILFLF